MAQQSKEPCKKEACDIQACLSKNMFDSRSSHPNAITGNHQSSHPDANAGMDMLDLLFSKGKEGNFSATSPQPPLFCGSPPGWASNPFIHNSRFGQDCPSMPAWPVVASPMVAVRPTPRSALPLMSPRSGAGCARAHFALLLAAVRVKG
ncbi:hypothetical protein GUJ93_ZPchr0012g18992 [Zizania palustris]|uniref:Uncharacterized protein n=1 Tax=Zizania palustris TaxID=103762 RepID=A0A8J5WKN7_ZIZPA|nr:hypothetical protein GUJ93_ZPchr0012g18992 [Zizania palustris]